MANPLYGQNKADAKLNQIVSPNIVAQSGTAAEDLSSVNVDTLWYSAEVQAGAITLPQATPNNVGMVIKIIAAATWSSTAFKLGFLNGGSTTMVGTIRVGTLNAVLTTGFAVTASTKALVIDANAVATAGGGMGSTYTFTYLAEDLVHVDAKGYITTGSVATTAAATVTAGI